VIGESICSSASIPRSRCQIAASRRILVCPDALKETADARAASDAIASGVRDAIPDAIITCMPLADGGEGTLDVLASTMSELAIERAVVPGPRPDRDPVEAGFGVDVATGRAVVELAEAAGLARLAPEDRDPERTGTAGAGRLLDLARGRLVDGRQGDGEDRDGLDGGGGGGGGARRSREIVLALGGSGTVDGGLGAIRALGVEVVGPAGDPGRPLVGGDLASVRDLRVPDDVRDRWAGVRLRVLADVCNPLAGPTGAARIFAPQKGASPAAVERLEAGLVRWGELLATRFGVDPGRPGAGAAGGVGLALAAVLGATIEPGFDVVASLVGLDAAIAASDVVITSEGRLDRQSLMGKVIGGVLERAGRHGVPVVAVPGGVDAALPAETRRRFASIRSLESMVGPEAARRRPLEALRLAAASACRDLVG